MRPSRLAPGVLLALLPVVAGCVATAAPEARAGIPDGIDDPGITRAVERELAVDGVVPARAIEVSTARGVVTLTGRVDSAPVRRRAGRLAGSVRGVQAVVNALEVAPVPGMTARLLAADVAAALAWDPATERYGIAVDAEPDGRVRLTGTVDSQAEKRLAGEVARGVRGVTAVRNELAVDDAGERGDAEIRAEIRALLRRDARIDAARIDVTVEDGAVTLAGEVDSAIEKADATLEARVDGVESVDAGGLRVVDRGRRADAPDWSDSQVRDAVGEALALDPRVSRFRVRVHVDNAAVTLRGTVDHLKAKRAAASVARGTTGVRRVENRIRVRAPDDESGTRVARRVERALARDPWLAEEDIDVSVDDDVCTLEGEVDTWFERGQADDIASRTRGVERVDNRLSVATDLPPPVHDPRVDDWDYRVHDRRPGTPLFASRSDADLREEIETHLFWSPYVDDGQVRVSVDAGVARLEGTVDSWAEYAAAERNARQAGALRVENRLKVE